MSQKRCRVTGGFLFSPSFCLAFYFILEYSQVKMFEQFQVNSKATERYICMHLFSPNSLPSRLPHNTEQSCMGYTVSLWWLSILNTAVCTCPSQTPLPFRLQRNIEQSFLCYTVGPCCLSILNTAVCTCRSQTS